MPWEALIQKIMVRKKEQLLPRDAKCTSAGLYLCMKVLPANENFCLEFSFKLI